MPFAAVRDIEIHYEIHGTGDPVLFINGTGAALRMNPARGDGPLERHHQVLMYDQRGLGDTSKPDHPYTMADYADDAAALLDGLGWPRSHVVGVSFGGMVAQHLALRHPERVDRLVLACTSSGGAGGSSYDLLSLDDLAPPERSAIWLPLLDTRNDTTTDPPTYAPGLEAFVGTLARYGERDGDPVAAMGARRQLEARSEHDVWDQLPAITAPTLVIGGRYDGQAPPQNSERLASRIPGAELALCEGGHLFLMQDPTAWPAILAFLASTS